VPRSAGGETAAAVLRNRCCRWAGPFTANERCTLDPVHASQSGAGTKTLRFRRTAEADSRRLPAGCAPGRGTSSFLPSGGKSPLPARSAAPSKCSHCDWPRVGLGEIGTVICCHPPLRVTTSWSGTLLACFRGASAARVLSRIRMEPRTVPRPLPPWKDRSR